MNLSAIQGPLRCVALHNRDFISFCPHLVLPDCDVSKMDAQSEAVYEEGVKVVQNGKEKMAAAPKVTSFLLLGDDLAALWDKYSQWALERVKSTTHWMELQTVVRVMKRGGGGGGGGRKALVHAQGEGDM